ncbi:MAG: DUF2892 domain-containing protein [Bacteroidetes bacterium]|nr:DUF2892 domain-containing protein [Bacteroidota bacterium]
MKKNMGSLDRGLRILVAIAIGILFYFDKISGPFAYLLITLSIVFVLTSLVSFCPLYLPLKMNTRK